MAETLFTFNKNNYQDCQQSYRGDKNQEYYLGEYAIDSGAIIDVRADKKAIASYSIIRSRARTRQTFKRSWYHIRQDATDVIVLWFVKRGSLCITHSGGRSIAKAGDFALTKSMTPFTVECRTDEDSKHEALHVLMPAHIFRQFIPHEVSTGFAVAAGGKAFSMAEHILTSVLEDDGEFTESTAKILIDSALMTVSDTIKACEHLASERVAIAEQRLQEVLRFMDIHLSDPKLSTTMVASACGISPRYLSFLLKQNNMSFSEYVWDQRLKNAERWLLSTKPSEISIAEIAFRVGFKSPAHFSRMFKHVYKKGPREYRSKHEPISQPINRPHKDLFVGANNTLQ